MTQDYARSRDPSEDAEAEPFCRIGRIGAWSSGTFALGGVVILGFAGSVLPWRSEAAAYALRHGVLLMTPGLLWGGLLIVCGSTDDHGPADFGRRAVATSLMFVGVGLLFAGYWACNRYFAGQDAEPWTYLAGCFQVLIACAMPGSCLLSGLSVVAAYRAILAILDFVLFAGPEVPAGKGQPVAATSPRRGIYRRRYPGQGMSEDYLA